MKSVFAAAMIAGSAAIASSATAAPEAYALDPSHSQILFSYNHLGFSTTYGMFSGFEGEVMFDAENPDASSVSVTMPVRSMFTGWEARFTHFMSEDFFGASEDDMVSFTSTAINVTGDTSAEITGDLTLNGVTKPVVLEAVLNQSMAHPVEGRDWLGFSATTTLLRTDFGVGAFAPYVGDEVSVTISIEAGKVE